MIYHDRVIVVERVWTGEYDGLGNEIYEDVPTPHRAEVRPLGSDETPELITTRYRVFMAPDSEPAVNAVNAVTWRGGEYEIEGDVEPHSNHGRVHHLEFIVKRVTP